MILVDSSIWIDHLRSGEDTLVSLLADERVVCHHMVIGEVACGNIANRAEVLRLLSLLPAAPMASLTEVLSLIERKGLAGRGLGFVDVHILASTLLMPGSQMWTRDRRLASAASDLGIVYTQP